MVAIPVVDLEHGDIPVAARHEVRRRSLVSSCQRMAVLLMAGLPAFAVVALISGPSIDRRGLQLWVAGSVLVSLLALVLTGARWRQLPLLSSAALARTVVLLFGVPMVVQWGSLAAALRPGTLHDATVLAMLILVAVIGVFVAAGASRPILTVSLLAGIIVPNVIVFSVDHGATSAPAVLTIYGAALAVAIGTLAHREVAARERLIVRAEYLLSAVTSDRHHLSNLNAELQYRATHDMLMGIPNRELLQTELAVALETAAATEAATGIHEPVGLLFLDLDRFKFVNDTMGHQAGDALLVMVGERIKAALADENALVARVGGDELVVLMRRLESDDHLPGVADKLLAKFADPFSVDGVELNIGSSIGMAASIVGECADDLYRHADAALYVAKEQGRGRAVFADEVLRGQRTSRITTELALREALGDREIEAWIQPEVDLVSGDVIAGEALARWRLDDTVAEAGLFIDVAERSGLLEPLMFEMLRQVWKWRNETRSSLPIGVNISAHHLQSLLHFHAADPHRRSMQGLRLEIAETDLIRDFDGTNVLLQKARALGAEIILDDFGTGFSSMRMLSDLPIDGFKIDRTYVARLEHDLRVRRLVTSLAEFGRSCDMTVIAEGVETPSQAEFLMQIGIDRGQGLMYSAAVEPPAFDTLTRTGCRSAELLGQF